MANVNVKFNGKDFLLSCNDGQEDHLEQLSIELNDKFNKLKNLMGNIGENKLLLITAITVLDEYFETKKNIDIKKKEIESLKNKFKELKSLIYEYKNNKEQEILSLKKAQEKLNENIEQNNREYNKIIDNTTNQIESFIKKFEKNKPVL
tara:strand:+ start:561 stop:1007 length:447 start_codon:yes stop_codon:yes gene_type:complete